MCDDRREEALRRLRDPREPVFWGRFATTKDLRQLRKEVHDGDFAFVDGRAYMFSGAWAPLREA